MQLLIRKQCRKDATLKASLVLPDGTSRPISHSIQRGGPVSAGRVLVLRGLGLNRTTAGSARLCISSQRPACRTAEGLCQPPTGSAPGTCRAELRDSAGGCCSESAVEAGKDRPPARAKPGRPGRRRPPPRPLGPRRPPAAPARPLSLRPGAPLLLPQPSLPPLGLPTCVEASVFDTTAGAGGEGPAPSRYSLSAAACASAQALIAGQLNTAAAGQLAAPFAAAGCSDTQLCFLLQFVGAGTPGAKGLCDALARAARDLLKPLADAQALRTVYNALFPPTSASTAGGCFAFLAQAASYRLRATDGVNAGGGGCFSPSDFSCLSGSSTPPSPLAKPGFRAPAFLDNAFPPDAACAKDASGGPFRLQPSVQAQTVTIFPSHYTVYCFGVVLASPAPGPSAACSSTRVMQLAFQARADRRADLLSVIVRGPADQRRLPLAGDAWWALPGAAGTIGSRPIGDALWVRPVDWTVDTVRELSGRGRAQVCLELRSGVSLGDFCVGGAGGCSVAIYSSDTCCPVGAAGAAA
ncbi:hypothetical protein HYH03_011824 [Edaphochlamys debaryana]|uniref:Pherophorin domain-containing protein n=1 Tax=Edaphochlamys debaryana TaxID=47281 RepID=A0A836BV61_9CHLO|nr:hypothetical protein HYH03_011824 [Edaphochlamys debaryana]|eukprot:KAG2489717.1 hypothetical protein HYH03_011824 [Edaphochlamys debaryana]